MKAAAIIERYKAGDRDFRRLNLRGQSFKGVLQVPTEENPDPLRKPDNNKKLFNDGEFGDFIKSIVAPLDFL